MISEKFIICILRFLACFPFCELYGGCIIVDIFQTLFTKNTKHCVSNTSGEIISLASTLSFNLNIHKKLVFYYIELLTIVIFHLLLLTDYPRIMKSNCFSRWNR